MNPMPFQPCLESACSPAEGRLPHTEEPGAGGGAHQPHPRPGLDAVDKPEAGAGELSAKRFSKVRNKRFRQT